MEDAGRSNRQRPRGFIGTLVGLRAWGTYGPLQATILSDVRIISSIGPASSLLAGPEAPNVEAKWISVNHPGGS